MLSSPLTLSFSLFLLTIHLLYLKFSRRRLQCKLRDTARRCRRHTVLNCKFPASVLSLSRARVGCRCRGAKEEKIVVTLLYRARASGVKLKFNEPWHPKPFHVASEISCRGAREDMPRAFNYVTRYTRRPVVRSEAKFALRTRDVLRTTLRGSLTPYARRTLGRISSRLCPGTMSQRFKSDASRLGSSASCTIRMRLYHDSRRFSEGAERQTKDVCEFDLQHFPGRPLFG